MGSEEGKEFTWLLALHGSLDSWLLAFHGSLGRWLVGWFIGGLGRWFTLSCLLACLIKIEFFHD